MPNDYSSEKQRERTLLRWGTVCVVPECGKSVVKFRLCEDHLPCKADDCGRESAVSERLCQKHYMRLQRWGTYEDIDHRKKPPRICSGEDCDRKAIAFGLCQKHYTRQVKFGTTELPVKMPAPALLCACGCGEEIVGRVRKYVSKGHAQHDARYRRYGLTRAIYLAMLEEQANRCPICNVELGAAGSHIDHCHTTGKVRGILCNNCNAGIGYLGDDPERTDAASAYLRKHAP